MKAFESLLVGTTDGVRRYAGNGVFTHFALQGKEVTCMAAAGGTIYVGLNAQGVARSLDGGKTFVESGPLGAKVVSVAPDPHKAGRVYAGCQPPQVLVSEDGGESWTRLVDLMTVPGAEEWEIPIRDFDHKVTSSSVGDGAAVWTLVVDPHRANRIIAGVEVGGLVVTEDGGKTWTAQLIGDTPDAHFVCMHPTEPEVTLVSTGFSRFTSERGVFRYGEKAGMHRSTDNLRTFERVWLDDPEPQYTRALCIDPRAPYTPTVAVRSSYVQKSNPNGERRAQLKQSFDGGKSWVNIGSGITASYTEEFSAVLPSPQGEGDVFVGTDRGTVFHVTAKVLQWDQLGHVGAPVTALLNMGAS